MILVIIIAITITSMNPENKMSRGPFSQAPPMRWGSVKGIVHKKAVWTSNSIEKQKHYLFWHNNTFWNNSAPCYRPPEPSHRSVAREIEPRRAQHLATGQVRNPTVSGSEVFRQCSYIGGRPQCANFTCLANPTLYIDIPSELIWR